MNKHTFFSRARRTALLACKLILIITAFLSTMSFAQEQKPVDLFFRPKTWVQTITLGQDFQFGIPLYIQQERQASGVIVTVELPEGITPLSASMDKGQCSFTDNLITCNLGVVGEEGARYTNSVTSIRVTARATSKGFKDITTRITANEPDPNLSNNTMTIEVYVKSRARVRLF